MKTKRQRHRRMCNYGLVLDEAIRTLENKLVDYEELVMIRERVVTNNLTDELYTFIDKHHGLESLFHGMPRASEVTEASLEDIQVSQVRYIDAAIEGIISDVTDLLKKIWNKFCDWVLDWIDNNRRLKFRLIRHKRLLAASPMEYGGDPAHYAKIKGNVFNYKDGWLKMYEAVRNLEKLFKDVPQNDPHSWYQSKFNQLAAQLKIFGYKLNAKAEGYSDVIQDVGMEISKQESVVGEGGAGWTRKVLVTAVDNSIDMLEQEESARTGLNALRRAFDRAISGTPDMRDVAALKRLIKMSKLCKDFAGMVARAVSDTCNIVRAAS